MSLSDEIRSKGYWSIVIHPATYQAKRADLSELEPIVNRARVQLRGWDFPHFGERDQIKLRMRSIACSTDWQYYVEAWRLYQSGQFTYLIGIHEDWLDRTENRIWGPPAHLSERGPLLGVGDSLFRITETFEFARRLAVTSLGDEAMHIKVEVHQLEGRLLWVDNPNRYPMEREYRAEIQTFVMEERIPTAQLVAESRSLAADWARELFMRFGWSPPIEMLRGQQEELRWQAS